MKLLLDNNLSYKLVEQLADVYPDTSHVALLRLDAASDHHVWEVAKSEGYCLVSKVPTLITCWQIAAFRQR